MPQTKGERQPHQRADVYPAARIKFSRAPATFRYAGNVLLALLLLFADALPAQSRIEASVLEGIAGSCPGRKVAIDPDLTRACRAYTAAVQDEIARWLRERAPSG